MAGDSVAGGFAEAPDRPAGEQRPGEAAAAAAVPAAVPAVTPSAVTSHGPGPARLDPDPTGAGSLGARDEAAKLDPGMNSETGAPGDEPLIGDQPHLREDWQDIQAAFVDDPGGSVRRAADLAETVVRMLLDSAEARTRELRGEWDGGQADTEALRLALRRYRVFIDRLCVV